MTFAMAHEVVGIDNSGTQDIPLTDMGGIAPEGAFLILTRCLSSDRHVDNAEMSMGFYDGTTECTIQIFAEHGGTNSNTDRIHSSSLVACLTTNGTNPDVEVSGSGFDVDEISVVIDQNTPAAAYQLHIIAWGGTDIANAGAEYHDDLTVTEDIPLGFQADFVLTLCNNNNAPYISPARVATNAMMVIGAWDANQDAQMNISFDTGNADGNSVAGNYFSNAHILGQHVSITGTVWDGIAATEASGYTISEDGGQSFGSDITHSLGFEWTTAPQLEIIEATMPGTDADWEATSLFSFVPEFVLLFVSRATANQTYTQTATQTLAVISMDGNRVLSSGVADKYNEPSMETSVWGGVDGFYLGDGEQADTALASGVVTFPSGNGFSVALAAGEFDAVARKCIAIGFRWSPDAAAGEPVSAFTPAVQLNRRSTLRAAA